MLMEMSPCPFPPSAACVGGDAMNCRWQAFLSSFLFLPQKSTT